MAEPVLHTRERLLERRRDERRRRRRRRTRRAGLGAAVAVAVVAALVAATHRDAPASAVPVSAGLLRPHASVFPPRARLAELDYVARGSARGRRVALTFDDGPGPYTLRIVEELRRLRAPATFFQVGVTEHYWTEAESAQLNDPLFVIGDHTQRHRRLDRLSPADQRAEIDEQAAVLRAAGVPQPTLFRPPYGVYDAATLALLRERGMTMVMWSVDSEDYRRLGVDAIVKRVLTDVRPGAIVLLHDAGGDRSQTLAALPRIVSGLRERGYTLVTVPTLIHEHPPPLKQPAMGFGAG